MQVGNPGGPRVTISMTPQEWQVVQNVLNSTMQAVQNQLKTSQTDIQSLFPVIQSLQKQLQPQPMQSASQLKVGPGPNGQPSQEDIDHPKEPSVGDVKRPGLVPSGD
jgi:hypothetical protein